MQRGRWSAHVPVGVDWVRGRPRVAIRERGMCLSIAKLRDRNVIFVISFVEN